MTAFAASGPIVAKSGQVISGMRITNPNGPCIRIPAGVTNVTVRDSDIGPCASAGIDINAASNATIEYNFIHNSHRGMLASQSANIVTQFNKFDTFFVLPGDAGGNALGYIFGTSGTVNGNVVTGSNYDGDVANVYQSSNVRFTNNNFDVHIRCSTCAAFTIGDGSKGSDPGSNNYIAGNIVRQSGTGVPAGIFGSSGNTILEGNCFTAGIQAYNYAGTFVGVTVRNNVINLGASFVPVTSVLNGWSTNINSTNCALVPH